MALQIAIPAEKLGIAIPAAYVRVVETRSTGSRTQALVSVYASAEARQTLAPLFSMGVDVLTPDNDPLFTGIYNHLKTLPEFAGAVDC